MHSQQKRKELERRETKQTNNLEMKNKNLSANICFTKHIN